MASEWAMKTAEEVIGIFDCTSSKKPLRLAIAAEIDAARIKGLEEAAEIAKGKEAVSCQSDRPTVICVTSGWNSAVNSITSAIRATIKAQKAGKG